MARLFPLFSVLKGDEVSKRSHNLQLDVIFGNLWGIGIYDGNAGQFEIVGC
jgi:hypothetical protein